MIIAVAGAARAGKDTVGRMIFEELGADRVRRFAFAEPIKRICAEIFDWDDRHLHGELKDVPDERYPRPITFSYPSEPPHGSLWMPLAGGGYF